MSVVSVVAEVDGNEYGLSETENGYESTIVAPEESTDVSVTATDENGNARTVSTELNVNCEWLPPKTDWISTDYFNIVDYNRIIGNIRYLKNFAKKLFLEFDILSMGEEKTYVSMIYAREMNAIESNLEIINANTYGFDIGETQTFQANKSTPLWSEFNRIESACLLLYNTMIAHKNALPRLAFTLGGQKGIRV